MWFPNWRELRVLASIVRIGPFVIACVIYALSGNHAQAQAVFTCAQLDASRGGTPLVNFPNDVNLTVGLGDRVTLNSVGGTVDVTFPDGVLVSVPVPATLTVTAGQVGVWNIGSFSDISCTSAVTPKVDGLFSTFMRVGSSVIDTIEIPGVPQPSYKPASGDPLKFSASPVLATPPSEPFGFTSSTTDRFAALAGSQGSDSFRFSVDLRSLINGASRDDAAALGGNDSGGTAQTSQWNAWVSGRYNDIDDDSTLTDRDGHQWSVTSGVSYQVSAHTVIGAFSRIRSGEIESNGLVADLESDFYGGGAFIETQFFNGLSLTGAALYEAGDNDISIQGITGNFDSDQWTIESRLKKRIMRGRHWLEPTLNVLYTHADRDGYTDSVGAVFPGSELELGRLTYGPKIGTTIHGRRALIKPFIRVNGIWDFANEGDFALADVAVISSADAGLNAGGGVEFTYRNGTVLKVSGDWYDFDDDLTAWSVTGSAAVPLSVLGIGHGHSAGLVSLDLAASADDASAKARIRIPLGGAE